MSTPLIEMYFSDSAISQDLLLFLSRQMQADFHHGEMSKNVRSIGSHIEVTCGYVLHGCRDRRRL